MAGPIMVYRAGGVRASVLQNEIQRDGQAVSVPHVRIQRSYKADDTEWKTTDSFRINDLPKVALVASKAYEFLALTEAEALNGQ